ncbi:MAG: sigma-70 family RNA polymerase sigma factor [Alphaproteobacteria bacterium]|nr:sigma-70 family RNA polymerase sigma factor [Alphaproteobacteria bacterium]
MYGRWYNPSAAGAAPLPPTRRRPPYDLGKGTILSRKFDLVEPHIPSLRRYAMVLLRYDEDRSDDLVQDCLVRAMSKWHLWRRPGNLRAWLFTILHNIYVNDVQKAAARPNVIELQEYLPGISVPPDQGDGLALREVAQSVQRLPEDQRQVLLLIGLEGFSYQEAAEIAGIPVGTVMSRLSRARRKLRDMLEDGDNSIERNVT